MNAGLSLAERDVLQSGLQALQDTVPPRAVWERIEAQARAEQLFAGGFSSGTRWLAGSGIAAAVVVAVLNLPAIIGGDGIVATNNGSGADTAVPDSTPDPAEIDTGAVPTNLNTWMVQSQRLEQELRALPGRPSLVRASTAATIAEIEDRIAAIDYRLNHPRARLSAVEAEIYWRERVRLMNSLLNLRRAQAQQMAF